MGKAYKLLIAVAIMVLMSHFVSSITEITVYETDLISLQLRAYDEDGDPLAYSFSAPLDSAGRWQTDYGDAGEYMVDIVVSDGKTSTTEHAKIIVLAKNRPPEIENIHDLVAKEGDEIVIDPVVTDYEGDDVTFRISPPIGNDGVWKTGHGNAGVYNISVIASDGKNEVVEQFVLTVLDDNRAPLIESYTPLEDQEINETDRLGFEMKASDPDHENLYYAWYIDGEKISDKERFTYIPDYSSAGTHEIKGTVSDGKQISTIYWKIIVRNKNRAPILKEIADIKVKEGDLIKIKPSATDADGDTVAYSFSEPFNENGEWQTTNDDAGIHNARITASDGELIAVQDVKITVEDVDRTPIFTGEIEDIEINEGDELNLLIGTEDHDGDIVEITAKGLPQGANIDGNKLTYKPDYAVIRKPDNWLNSLLQKLHMDWLFGDKKSFRVTLTAQAKELSAKKKIKITVLDTNRAPKLQDMKNITIKENDILILKPEATDYDHDKLSYTISGPVFSDGKWETDFDDNGIYDVVVTASDGELEDSQTIKLTVENLNRQPVFKELPLIKVNENEELSFKIKNKVTDADGDPIEIKAENLPKGAVFEDGVLTWKPNYEVVKEKSDGLMNKLWSRVPLLNKAFSPDKKEVAVKFVANDGKSAVEEELIILVKNVNRLPKLSNTYPPFRSITAFKNQPIIFGAVASDSDNDSMRYTWKLGGLKVIKGTPVISKSFAEPGVQKVELEISDGLNSVTKTWNVKVQ
jgi:hypothetical protein